MMMHPWARCGGQKGQYLHVIYKYDMKKFGTVTWHEQPTTGPANQQRYCRAALALLQGIIGSVEFVRFPVRLIF